MNHREKLLEIYGNSFSIDDISLERSVLESLYHVVSSIESQKGVFTVLITLGVHKLLNPSQDVRYHQDNMTGGFSGRSIDTKFITPTLKSLKLTSMSESGWLTRSLEQPYPYTMEYNGKVGSKIVKKSFLEIVYYYQTKTPKEVYDILRVLLNGGIRIRERNNVTITPLSDPDKITIDLIIRLLNEYFETNYHISGGSKLPVISFYTIYQILIRELMRFQNCSLGNLGSHTSSDRTSKSSGDIEVFSQDVVMESVEIKYSIDIDLHIVNRVVEKIHKFNPKRYYILTTLGIKQEDYDSIMEKIYELKVEHGCQLIINGLVPTLKYYLRLISNPVDFFELFTQNIFEDGELKVVHKEKWRELYESVQ